MTNPQNYVAVPVIVPDWSKSLPVDTVTELGVNSKTEITPALKEARRIMREIRATGRCGMFVARWDGQAWCFHVCDAPARINES